MLAENRIPVVRERGKISSVLSLVHEETMQGMWKSLHGGDVAVYGIPGIPDIAP